MASGDSPQQRGEWRDLNEAPGGQRTASAEATCDALRSQTTSVAGDTEFFSLYEEELGGTRPDRLYEVRPQERVQRLRKLDFREMTSFVVAMLGTTVDTCSASVLRGFGRIYTFSTWRRTRFLKRCFSIRFEWRSVPSRCFDCSLALRGSHFDTLEVLFTSFTG